MYFEIIVEGYDSEQDYSELVKTLGENGIEAKLVHEEGKNMFAIEAAGFILNFVSNVAAGVIAAAIFEAIKDHREIRINGKKVKTDSKKEIEKAIEDIQKDL